jgi:microcystin-dependent protein
LIKKVSLPKDSVLAFNRSRCPLGWVPLSKAAGRVIVGVGAGEGLTGRALFELGGEEKHILTEAEMPSHSHTVAIGRADTSIAGDKLPYIAHPNQRAWKTDSRGGSQPHNNMPPFIALLYCIKE